jgi:non-homologous end joining protein Ku
MTDFDLEKYTDQHRKKILDILKKKMKHAAPVEAPHAEEEESAGPADLVAALTESMLKVKKNR